jgi:peptidoglycan/LPS O-acetylase OafA/YrhL
MMATGARVTALDGLRGMAILLVMLYHQTIAVGSTPVDRFVGFWTLAGWAGVDLFFVLSGFLITGILLDAKRSSHYFRNFYARRILRIFPLYYAVVAFSLLVLPHIPNWKSDVLGRIQGDEFFYWTYLSNISIAIHNAFRHGILDISWSLAIEEQFYLTWPALVLLLDRRQLMRLCICVFFGAIVWRVSSLAAGTPPIAVYVLAPGRLDALAVGAFIALAARSGAGLESYTRQARYTLMASSIVFLAIGILDGGFDPYARGVQTVGFTALAVMFGSLLLLSVTASPQAIGRRLLQQPVLVAFGKYSYALYLFHLPIRAIVRDRIYGPDQFLTVFGSSLPGQLLFYVIASSAAFFAAWLSWHMYERHFIALKGYFASTGVDDHKLHIGWLAGFRRRAMLMPRKRVGI